MQRLRPRSPLLLPLFLLLVVFGTTVASCGIGDLTYQQLDPASIPANVTYVHDIAPRMDYFCTGCHSPDSSVGVKLNRDLSSATSVCGNLGEILRTAFALRSMPPGAAERMHARDGAMLLAWQAAGCPECNRDDDCPGERRCVDSIEEPTKPAFTPNRLCACLADAECGENRKCDTARGVCVNCLATADCGGALQCRIDTGRCVSCLDDSHCTNAGRGKCKDNNVCVECLADADCTADPQKDKCNDACVQCLADSDCTGGQTCDTRDGTCK